MSRLIPTHGRAVLVRAQLHEQRSGVCSREVEDRPQQRSERGALSTAHPCGAMLRVDHDDPGVRRHRVEPGQIRLRDQVVSQSPRELPGESAVRRRDRPARGDGGEEGDGARGEAGHPLAFGALRLLAARARPDEQGPRARLDERDEPAHDRDRERRDDHGAHDDRGDHDDGRRDRPPTGGAELGEDRGGRRRDDESPGTHDEHGSRRKIGAETGDRQGESERGRPGLERQGGSREADRRQDEPERGDPEDREGPRPAEGGPQRAAQQVDEQAGGRTERDPRHLQVRRVGEPPVDRDERHPVDEVEPPEDQGHEVAGEPGERIDLLRGETPESAIDADHPAAPAWAGSAGAVMTTEVPAPGAVQICTRPPTASMRSTTDARRPNRSGATAARSKPDP